MRIAYQEWNPRPDSVALVDAANVVLQELGAQGYTLTLRQLYYQFVSRGWIENTERSYKNLGKLVTNARMAGLIDWTAIEDRNRGHMVFPTCEDEDELIANLEYQIRYDFWERQPYYVEVWVEKEALGNVIAKACRPWKTPYMSCKGYLSASEAWRAGRRMLEKYDEGKECVVIHLGDHDPSGIDMTRDNQDRLDTFAEVFGAVKVRRIALNMDQVEQHNPPPNPAKFTDSRAGDYVSRYGTTSWELDALKPHIIEGLISDEISSLVDHDIWGEVQQQQDDHREIMRKLHEEWPVIKEGL